MTTNNVKKLVSRSDTIDTAIKVSYTQYRYRNDTGNTVTYKQFRYRGLTKSILVSKSDISNRPTGYQDVL